MIYPAITSTLRHILPSLPRSSRYIHPLLVSSRKLCSDSDSEYSDSDSGIMDVSKVVGKLNKFAPKSLAGSWDNVGLLIEPSLPHVVNKLLLTNDLTEVVMEEAVNKKVDMILAYHPPIFAPLKRLTQSAWKERIVVKCIENRIALYSPHTSFDAVKGGVNDWLLEPFIGDGESLPLEAVFSPMYPTPGGSRVEFNVPCGLAAAEKKEISQISKLPGVTVVAKFAIEEDSRHCLNCTEKALPRVVEFINRFEKVKETMEILNLNKPPIPHHGPGRIATLPSPITVQEAVEKVKQHLKLPHVRLALAKKATTDAKIKTVAVCAGSGGSVLKGVKADLYVTGEMSHHEVLEACHKKASVILCEHSNTERLYLSKFKDILDEMLENKVELLVSETDRDPLEVV